MNTLKLYARNKEMPDELRTPILKALSHYPELLAKEITFQYTRRASTSVMKAQPLIKSMMHPGVERAYLIYVNQSIRLGGQTRLIKDFPEEVLIGWFGHELGHVMDYESRGNLGMLTFGLAYLLSPAFIKKAESRADELAIEHGMHEFILKTKEFILKHADVSEKYKRRIRKYYPSPERIMELVKEREELAATG